MKLSDFIFEYILNIGTECVFMLPGGGAMHLVDSLGRSSLTYIANLHEQGAVIAAEAFAQFRQNIGCALVTTGPGGTNAITGVAAAWLDSTPLLIISGQVKRNDLRTRHHGVRQYGFQEINILDIVRPITKYSALITEPEKILYHLQKAIHKAMVGRPGPVWLDIPLDVQASNVNLSDLSGYSPSIDTSARYSQVDQEIESIIRLINESKRPIILAGNGVRLSRSENQFFQLINELGIPVQTTWKTIDLISDDNPLFAGRPGTVASRWANLAVQHADLLIAIGARLDVGTTAYNPAGFAKNAKKILVDVDPTELKKHQDSADILLHSDAGYFIRKMLEVKDRISRKDLQDWLGQIHKWKKQFPIGWENRQQNGTLVNDYEFLDRLSDLVRPGDILVPGSSGACSERTMQAFRVSEGIRIINSPGLGSMGFGLPASIGACIASGKKRTICINGDGGFFLNIQELEVVNRLKLPIKFFILNNNGYASIRNTQKRFFNRYVASTPESGMTLPSIRRVAEAFGLPTTKIENNKNLKKQLAEILDHNGPIVCEVMSDPSVETIPRVISRVDENGNMTSTDLAEMYPYINT